MLDIQELSTALIQAKADPTISLRYDTKTPNLVHVMAEGRQVGYHRLTATTVGEAMKELMNCSGHVVYPVELDDYSRDLFASTPQEVKDEFGIVDIFEVDNRSETILLIKALNADQAVMNLMQYHIEKEYSDPDEQLITKVVMSVTDIVKQLPDIPIDARSLAPILPPVKMSPELLALLAQRLRTSPDLAGKLNQVLDGLVGSINLYTEQEMADVRSTLQAKHELSQKQLECVKELGIMAVVVAFVSYLEQQFPWVIRCGALARLIGT